MRSKMNTVMSLALIEGVSDTNEYRYADQKRTQMDELEEKLNSEILIVNR